MSFLDNLRAEAVNKARAQKGLPPLSREAAVDWYEQQDMNRQGSSLAPPPPSPTRDSSPGQRRAQIEGTLRDIVETTGASQISRRIVDPLINRIPERVGPPPDEIPDSWVGYNQTVLPIVNHFLRDTRRVLQTWSRDPVVLCCLIRNLAAMDVIDRAINRGARGGISILYQMRTVLDFLLAIMKKDVGAELNASLDFLRFIMIAVVGAVVTTLDILRKHLQAAIFRQLNLSTDSVINRCLPFKSMIKVVLSAIQDPINGIFAKVQSLITDWTNHIKAQIHVKFNCGELVRSEEERSILQDQSDDVENQIRRIDEDQGQGRRMENLRGQQAQIQKSLNAVKSKISLNQGVPLIGKAGCFIRKVEFIQQLKFYRRIINLIIQGLERGTLCANTDPDMIARSSNPLDALGLDGPSQIESPFPHRIQVLEDVFPTDDELIKFAEEHFHFDDPAAEYVLGLPRRKPLDSTTGDEDLSDRDTSGDATLDEFGHLVEQIQEIETIADCTSVMGPELVGELVETFNRLGR